MHSLARRLPLLRSLVATLTILVCAAASARAQTIYTIGANAGLVIPVSDLGNATSSGYTIAATLGMRAPLTPVSFRVEGSYTELPFKDNISSGSKYRIYGFALDATYNMGTVSTNGGFYLTGGLGYFGAKATDTFFGDSQTNWNIGLNAGLGYYLPLSGFTMYFEGRYRNIFSDTHQVMFPITVGITF